MSQHGTSRLTAVDLTSPSKDELSTSTPVIHSSEAAALPAPLPVQPAPTTPPHLRHASSQWPPAPLASWASTVPTPGQQLAFGGPTATTPYM